MKNRKLLILIYIFSFPNVFAQIDSNKYFENSKQFLKNENYEKALIEIDKALDSDSLNRDYLLQKIKIQYFNSDCNSAFETLEKLIKRDNRLCDETVSYFCDLSDCIKEPKMGTEILTKYVDAKKFESNEMLIRLGQRYFITKEYDKSIFYYRESIKLNPKDVNAIIDLARILYVFKNNSEEAKEELLKGLENNKNNILLLTYLASCYHNDNDINSAINIINQIIILDYNSEHIASRAMLYELKGEKSKAYNDYKKIIELNKCNLEYYLKILQYEFENRLYNEVIQNSFKLIECDKKNEEILLDVLYSSLFFCGDIDKGIVYLDKKLRLKPNTFNPYYFKANVLLRNGQYEEVLKYLNLALNTEDIDKENVVQINHLKFGYYLLKEDYNGFESYLKSNNVKSLDNNLNFTFIENHKVKKTEIRIDFNKENGTINSTVIIPTKVFKLLKNKYGLEIK
ncbi:tetratricopeptide repeat protein [Flavobacterium fontis]|nr:tetratricopeptide repeat protein [Flavobacterium fontis]